MTLSADNASNTDFQLRELIARGFQFLHPCDSDGEVVAIVGIRAHHNVIDVVRLHSEDDALAMRVPGDEENVLSPNTVHWQTTGDAVAVLNEVLWLPDEHAPGSLLVRDRTAAGNGCWVPSAVGRSKWLVATA